LPQLEEKRKKFFEKGMEGVFQWQGEGKGFFFEEECAVGSRESGISLNDST